MTLFLIKWSSRSFLSDPSTEEMSSPMVIMSFQKEGVSMNPLSQYFFFLNLFNTEGESGGGLGYLVVP